LTDGRIQQYAYLNNAKKIGSQNNGIIQSHTYYSILTKFLANDADYNLSCRIDELRK